MKYPELYVAFLYYFNKERDYYECHEVMEHLWLEQQRDKFLQGLLQVAVALYHFSYHNVNGSIKLFHDAIPKLENRPDEVMGIDLKKIAR